MAQIYLVKTSSSSSSSSYITSRRESFTLWMKSLVFHGNGCTVFDSNGKLVYRIDNYGERDCREVDLMDVRGNVLFSIQQKKISIFGNWDGYRCNSHDDTNKKNPRFQVRRNGKVLKGGVTTYVVSLVCGGAETSCYLIQGGGATQKSSLQIIGTNGTPVAHVKQKRSSSGVYFGEDVLSLVVEPRVDHSLIMALVTVYELINHRL